jgi:hypothetical protein
MERTGNSSSRYLLRILLSAAGLAFCWIFVAMFFGSPASYATDNELGSVGAPVTTLVDAALAPTSAIREPAGPQTTLVTEVQGATTEIVESAGEVSVPVTQVVPAVPAVLVQDPIIRPIADPTVQLPATLVTAVDAPTVQPAVPVMPSPAAPAAITTALPARVATASASVVAAASAAVDAVTTPASVYEPAAASTAHLPAGPSFPAAPSDRATTTSSTTASAGPAHSGLTDVSRNSANARLSGAALFECADDRLPSSPDRDGTSTPD